MKVFVLMRHPPYLYNQKIFIKEGKIEGLYADRAEPDRIAAEKNATSTRYRWTVEAKMLKGRK